MFELLLDVFYLIKCNLLQKFSANTYSTHAFYKLSNINIVKPGDLLSVKVVKLRLRLMQMTIHYKCRSNFFYVFFYLPGQEGILDMLTCTCEPSIPSMINQCGGKIETLFQCSSG